MLADTTLPPNVVSGLKAISSLLKPADNLANSSLQRPRNFQNLVNLNDVGSECDQDLPYTGERPSSLPKVPICVKINDLINAFLFLSRDFVEACPSL